MALQLFKIADVTVDTPVSTIDFTSIPQGYTDLIIKYSVRGTHSAATGVVVRPNGNTSNLSNRNLEGYSSSFGSTTGTNGFHGYIGGTNYTTNTFNNNEIYIPNYSGSSNKSISSDSVSENNSSTEWYNTIAAVLWSSTAAITSIQLALGFGSFEAQSTATLYGIL